MKKILVPTDFSETAHWAIELACDIALRAHADLIVLHIVEQPGDKSFNAMGQTDDDDHWEDKIYTARLIEKAKARLDQVLASIEARGLRVSSELRLGNTYHGIREMVTDHVVDLVVMGTNEHSRAEQVLLGSNTQKVVRFAKCPVLTVHQKPSANDFKNIVYATSMSLDEGSFAAVVKNAQELYGATIHLVRINTPMNFKPDIDSMKAMKRFVEKLHITKYTLSIFNDLSEEEGIVHFAETVNADLIAMATHGRTGFAHMLVGSIAEDVVNHSRKPVLTFVTPNLNQN